MVGGVTAVGQIGGPLLGGLIAGHLGWRWAFYINIPIGLICIVWCQVMLHVPAARRGKITIDWIGIVLLTAAISAFVLAATWAGSTYAWTSWQICTLGAVAVAALAAFIVAQKRVAEPLMPLRIFTGHRNFPLASVLLVVVGVATFGATLYLPLYQQTVQGATATNSGLLLLPMMIATLITSNIASKVMTATGKYKVFPVLGGAFITAGMALLSTMDTETSQVSTACYMAILGCGSGFVMQISNTIAQNSVALRDIGAASATTNLFRSLGGSLGVAIFGSLFATAITGIATPAAKDAYLHAVANGTHTIFLTGTFIAAVAFLAALLIKEVPLRGEPDAHQPTDPATPVAR